MRRQDRKWKLLEILRERYDVYGAEDPIYFDTFQYQIKRTLQVLERDGFIVCWVDAEDPSRMWAAALDSSQSKEVSSSNPN